MKKKRHLPKRKIASLLAGLGKFLLKSQLLTLLLLLSGLGFLAGIHARPDPNAIPYEDLFESLNVLSYREAPSDSTPRFVVELAARGRVFQQYDVDARRFMPPVRGHDYGRSISGTRYRPLEVRGHVDRGFWLELPETPTNPLPSDQFDELYRTSLEYVKPVSAIAVVVGTLSGYSIGYRAATWGTSLSNPSVQERLLAAPGIGRAIAREAWRRVLLEPVITDDQSDTGRLASVRGTQRIYTNFFKLAENDSNGFIPREAARLDSLGHTRESRAMVAFAQAVRHAAQDTCDLTSADFRAVEEWASLLDRRGHWAVGAIPPAGEERMKYLGMLAWYGLAPTKDDERRIWVGPRVLVRMGDTEGFVADDIPSCPVGCPTAWKEWLRTDNTSLSANPWSAQWMAELRQFEPIAQMGNQIGRLFWDWL